MTREERAKYLNQLIIPDLFDNSKESCELRMKQQEALYETIAELMQEPYEELDFVQPHKKISVNLELCDDAISRQAAIDELYKMLHDCFGADDEELDAVITTLNELPPVTPQYTEAEIQKMQDLEFAEIQKAYEIGKAENPNKWIPVSERLPEELEAVNITWVNHEPEPYYHDIKDKNFVATGIYYKGQWYWYSTTCADYLGEYGSNEFDKVDSAVEIVAWMPLPEPYKEGGIQHD